MPRFKVAGFSIQLSDLRFRYDEERFALAVQNLTWDAGRHIAITGPSGCGKTTLLRLIGGMLTPDSGAIHMSDVDVSSLQASERRDFRLRHIGLVFQTFELLPYLTGLENILLPYRLSSALPLTPEVQSRARDLAQSTGVDHLLDARPNQLSQGEKQRLAVCRALVTEPSVVLADEPTGSLDPTNQTKAVELLHEQSRTFGATFVMVTHEPSLISGFDDHVHLPDHLQPPTES